VILAGNYNSDPLINSEAVDRLLESECISYHKMQTKSAGILQKRPYRFTPVKSITVGGRKSDSGRVVEEPANQDVVLEKDSSGVEEVVNRT